MQQVRVGPDPAQLSRPSGPWGSGNPAPAPAEDDEPKEGLKATSIGPLAGVQMIALSEIRHDQNVRQDLLGEEVDALAQSSRCSAS